MTTVSAIIPVYNDAAYLAEALDSVFGQTRPPEQVIVVDDGSTDGSFAIAQGYGSRIVLLQQRNQGISSARNTGVAAAGGDLIAFLDADDMWPVDSLERRLAALEANPELEAVYGYTEQFISPEVDPEIAQRLHCPEGQAAARFAGAMLLRRRLFETVGMFDLKLRVGETIDWALRLDDSGARVTVIEALVMRRRIHGDNTTVNQKASRNDYLTALRASLARKAALQAQKEPS